MYDFITIALLILVPILLMTLAFKIRDNFIHFILVVSLIIIIVYSYRFYNADFDMLLNELLAKFTKVFEK